MSIQCLERDQLDTRTVGERLHAIWEGLGESAVGLHPKRELQATMAAILLANDPSIGIEGITLSDLYVCMPETIDVATEERLW